MEEIQQDFTADAAGGPKRKIEEADITGERKMLKLEDAPPTTAPLAVVETTETPGAEAPDAAAKKPMNKAREIRLDQNRKAARESRRRKKTMIEELQRSVIFFSRANSTLKQQNDELSALLVQAQTQMANMEGRGTNVEEGSAAAGALPAATAPAPVNVKVEGDSVNDFQQAEAQAVATQAVLESQVCVSLLYCVDLVIHSQPYMSESFTEKATLFIAPTSTFHSLYFSKIYRDFQRLLLVRPPRP